MLEISYSTPETLISAVNDWCADRIARYSARSMYLPAGGTPRPVYSVWERERPFFLDGVELIQVDEVLGEGNPGRFRKFFMQALPSYAERIRLPGQVREDVDLAVLGLGRNGHVAFHEPGLPDTFQFGEVALAGATCRQLGLKPPQKGITYGLGSFMRCKGILLIVAGTGKGEAWRGFRNGSSAFPATTLRKHPDLTVLVDSENFPSLP